MSEPNKTNRKDILLWLVMLLVKPLLFFGAGALLIAGLALAQQRFSWLSTDINDRTEPDQTSARAHQEGEARYVCPMLCTPPLSEPGRCPECHMELVQASGGGGDGRSIQIDPASRRVANIRTATVASRAVSRQIRTVGELSYDEGRLKTLAAYVGGRIDRLYADYTGVVVSQGDNLALLFSPELYAAQSELLATKRTVQRTRSSDYASTFDTSNLHESSRQKLIDLGMTEQQIARLESSEQPVTRIELVAPIHGTVIEKLASEGEYVKTGQPIYRLADLSVVWLMLELFPTDAAAIHYGQHVEAEVQSLPGRKVEGRVAFIDPMVDPTTRTVGVRVVISNEDHRLKIGDYATATVQVPVTDPGASETAIYDEDLAGKWISPRHPHVIESQPGKCRLCGVDLEPASKFGFTDQPPTDREQLVVPRNAVLLAGDRSVVYVESADEPGRFTLRIVELGPRIGDDIVLYGGVQKGEQVATNGNFLIDSQMQLAGNPSLIDPAKVQPLKVATDGGEAEADVSHKIAEALAQLPPEDEALAQAQKVCPISQAPLGSMGVPIKVDVDGTPVFICCEGCRAPLLSEPEKHLANLPQEAKP